MNSHFILNWGHKQGNKNCTFTLKSLSATLGMIQLFSQLKPSLPLAQGALPVGPVWEGRDSLAPHSVWDYMGQLLGRQDQARVLSTLS